MKRKIIIIGGGVAGIAAAVRLCASDDCTPILIESTKSLGGRASSFPDRRTELMLDNCQHVVLGCCTNLLDLYARLDVLDLIDWHSTLHWTRGKGIIDRFRTGVLPAPLHLAGALRRMSVFTREDKKHIAHAMRALLKLGDHGRHAWRERPFVDFLTACGQSESVIQDFWNSIVISACNLSVDRVQAELAIKTFQDGFLGHRLGSVMGIPRVPLAELYAPAEEYIRASGGEVHLGVSARGIAYNGSRITGVMTDDGVLEGAAFLSALPPDRLHRIASNTLRRADPRLHHLDQFTFSPIMGVHLLFDQPVMELPHLVCVGTGIDWLFNKGRDEDGHQLVQAVVSAADAWVDMSEEAIVSRVMEDLHAMLPGARGVDPIAWRAVKEKHATFAATCEAAMLRPAAGPSAIGLDDGGVRNLFLAGDWCDTGWPASMESAARSGYAAASAITGEGDLVDDLPIGWLAGKLGLGR